MFISQLYRNIALIIILLLPFQKVPINFTLYFTGISRENIPFYIQMFSYIDELSFFIFLYIGVTFFFLQPKSTRFPRSALNYWLVGFVMFAMIVGIAKGVPIPQGAFGIYDVTKNLLIIHLFCFMKFERDEFLRAIRLILGVAMILAVVGFVAIILAMAFDWGVGLLAKRSYRLLPYQPFSLTGPGSHNYLGVYAVLVFFLAYGIGTPFSKFSQLNLLLLIVLTVSRQAWISFAAIYLLYKRRVVLMVSLPIFVALIIYSFGEKGELDPTGYFRYFAFLQSLKILAEHPFTGVGPGMFGDLASIIWDSPVYQDWPPFMKKFAFETGGLDQFWPLIWGEFGIIGLLLYANIFFALFLSLKTAVASFQEAGDDNLVAAGKALQYFVVALGIMGFVAGLNEAFVTYTYLALVGMYLSLYEGLKQQRSSEEEGWQESGIS